MTIIFYVAIYFASLCCEDNRMTQFGLCSDAGIDNWHLVVGSGNCNRALVRGSHRSVLITPATLLSQQVNRPFLQTQNAHKMPMI